MFFNLHSIDCKQVLIMILYAGLVQQLLMSQGGEEDMSALLVSLHGADIETDIELKQDILAALLNTFRESHRARCNFRRAGGFLYLMSVLVSMESFLSPTVSLESGILRERMHLVQLIFTAFALAMRFEPANAKLFHQEICLPSLADTLRLLGCFSRDKQTIIPFSTNPLTLVRETAAQTEDNIQLFHSIFTASPANVDPLSYQDKIPFPLVLCVFIFRLLYDLATDNYEKTVPPGGSGLPGSFRSSPRKVPSPSVVEDALNSSSTDSANLLNTGSGTTNLSPCTSWNRRSIGSLNLSPPTPEPVIVHSSVVIVMIKLIPSISLAISAGEGDNENGDTTRSFWMECLCQLYCAELVKSLVRNERNQQLMAQTGLTEEILERCSISLSDESHLLHQPIHYAFERVATHYLCARDLRYVYKILII